MKSQSAKRKTIRRRDATEKGRKRGESIRDFPIIKSSSSSRQGSNSRPQASNTVPNKKLHKTNEKKNVRPVVQFYREDTNTEKQPEK